MPGPSARILSPMSGDTVPVDKVAVTVCFANFPNPAVNLTCSVGGKADNPAPATGDDVHAGSLIANVPLGPQVATTGTVAHGNLHTVDNVIIVAQNDPLPVPIEDVTRLEGPGVRGRRIRVRGSSPGAAYVVCQIIEVNARIGTMAVADAGAATVDGNRRWSVDFDIVVRPEPHIQYVARAYAYDKNMQLLGSQSLPIRK